MHIQINTDKAVQGHEDVVRFVEDAVTARVGHFAPRITRVEAHLGDENGPKGGAKGKRCMLEARPEGLKPIAVTHYDATLKLAISGAAAKLRAALEREFGMLDARKA